MLGWFHDYCAPSDAAALFIVLSWWCRITFEAPAARRSAELPSISPASLQPASQRHWKWLDIAHLFEVIAFLFLEDMLAESLLFISRQHLRDIALFTCKMFHIGDYVTFTFSKASTPHHLICLKMHTLPLKWARVASWNTSCMKISHCS